MTQFDDQAINVFTFKLGGIQINGFGGISCCRNLKHMTTRFVDQSAQWRLADDLIIGQRDMYPGQGNYPTTLWAPGEIIADTYVVPVARTTLTPAVAQFEVGLYELSSGARLPVTALVDQFYADLQAAGGNRLDTSSLIKRLRTGNGGPHLEAYNSKAYRRPKWDLEAVD